MNARNLFILLVLLMGFVVLSSSVTQAQIYVSVTQGDDTFGNGTETTPYSSIGKAISVAASGSTIMVEAGTYNSSTVKPAQGAGTGEDVLAVTGSQSLTFVAYERGIDVTVIITNGIEINTSGTVSMGQTGETFNLGATANALKLTKGTLNIASAKVVMGSGATLTIVDGVLNAAPTVTSNLNVIFNCVNALSSTSAFLPSALGTGAVTINKATGALTIDNASLGAASITITNTAAVTIGSNVTTTGAISVAGGTAAVTINGSVTAGGNVTNASAAALTLNGNVTVGSATAGAAADILNTSTGTITVGATSANTLTLSTTIDAGANAGTDGYHSEIVNSSTGSITVNSTVAENIKNTGIDTDAGDGYAIVSTRPLISNTGGGAGAVTINGAVTFNNTNVQGTTAGANDVSHQVIISNSGAGTVAINGALTTPARSGFTNTTAVSVSLVNSGGGTLTTRAAGLRGVAGTQGITNGASGTMRLGLVGDAFTADWNILNAGTSLTLNGTGSLGGALTNNATCLVVLGADQTIAGLVTNNGNIKVNATTLTLSRTAAPALAGTGDIYSVATATTGSGVVKFTGDVATSTYTGKLPNVEAACKTSFANVGNVIYGNLVTSNTGTVSLATAATDVKANLNLNGTGAVTINFATTVRGDLNLTAAASLTLAADLTVEGTFNMPQGIFAFGANTLTLKGNFNRTGGTISAANAGTGSLVFNGGNSQTFTPGVQMNVYNVTVNNQGAYVAGFVEDQNIITVTGALLVLNDFTITKGLVAMGTNNIRMEQTTGSARFTNNDRGYTATGIGGLIFEGDGANTAAAGDGAVITGTKPFSNIYVRLTTAANNVYCLGAVVISGTVTLDGGGIIWNDADDAGDLFTSSTLTLDQSLTGTAYPTVVINTVNTHGSPFLVDGADGGAVALAITTYYNLSYTGNTDATMSATDFVTAKVNNLSIVNGGSGKTITGLGGPMAIAGNLSVNALETLNLTNGGAQTLTLSSNSGAHAVSGTVTGGTLAITGNAASLTGGVGTTNASSVAILTVTNASGTFVSTGMKVLADVTMNGASLVSTITMNAAAASITTFVNTAGTTVLNMNSTASAIGGNFTVTAGAVTLTMNGAAAGTRTITGNLAVNGGSLTLGSTINVTGTVGQTAAGSIALGDNNLILADTYSHAGTGTVTAGTGVVIAENASVKTFTLTSTVTIPNLTVKATGIQLVTNGLTVSNALVHTAGSIDLNSLPLTVSGNTYTYTAGTYTTAGAAGVINLTGKNVVIGGSGSPTIPYLTINSDSIVTINPTGTPATARTLTISNLLTQTKGTLALGINDVVFNPGTGYTFTAGAITAATSTAAANTNVGELVFSGATGFTPGAAKSLTIPNLRIDAATAVAGTDSFYVANRLTFGVGSLTCAAGRMILNDNVAIYRTGAGTLSAVPQFAGVVDVTYMTTGTTTGVELPTSSTALRNLTVNIATTLGAPVKTNGTLTLGAVFTTTAPNVDTLAVGSTVAVNGGSISAPVVPLGAYNLSYAHNADVVTTNNEWPLAASITDLTVAMNGADLKLNANRTVTDFTLNCTNGGGIDLSNGGTPYTLTVTGLTTLTAGTLMTTTTGGTLVVQGDVDAAGGTFGNTVQMSFTGSSNQTITTPTGGATIGNITINKASGFNIVEVAGGDLTCGGIVTFNNGLLKTGETNGLVLTNSGGANAGKGFVRNIATGGKSHVVGNVRQNLQFSQLISFARNEFPVGDTANYRPVALTFVNSAGNGNFGITATVSHTNSRPTGTAGLPIANGIVDGVDLAKYPSFFWSIKTDGPMGATAFNLDLTAAGFDPAELDLDDIGLNRVKIIRRSGIATDIENQWNLQGDRDSYDNVISAGVPNVTAINATGGLSASGAIFTYGLKSTLFVQNLIANQSLSGTGSTYRLKLNTTAAPVFGGNTGALTFTTNSSNTTIATSSISATGDTLVVQAMSDGVAVIMVTAMDIDNSQISTQFNVTVLGAVGVTTRDLPTTFALFQNHPNPFNPTTNISFDVPQNSSVKIVIYDMLGREVTTLVNTNYAPGKYTVPFNASRLSSGMYIYRMTSQPVNGNMFTSTKKLMLVK